VLTAVVAFIGATSASRPTSGVSRPAANQLTSNQLTSDQLRPGDCLAGSNMGFGKAKQWPEYVTRVACTQPHEAEVFFAGNAWPPSLAYPGDSTVTVQASNRCEDEFALYDGIEIGDSAFTAVTLVPDSSGWASGKRSLQCVAYEPDLAGPSGAMPVTSSIKGTDR
jgi:hypothetical protein